MVLKKIALTCLGLVLLAGCKEIVKSNKDTISTIAPPTSGTGTVTHVDIAGGAPFKHTQAVGDASADLYFIFTNPNSSAVSGTPSYNQTGGSPDPLSQEMVQPELGADLQAYARAHKVGLRGSSEITAYNANPPQMTLATGEPRKATAPLRSAVGDTFTFYTESSTETVAATLRGIKTDGTVTVNLWVANDSWSSCLKANCMTQTMVDALGDKFLTTGAANDIYDWVTNLYGEPWGTHAYSNLIPVTAKTSIDILFYDISNDNSTTGGILGFFYSKDNYLSTSVSFSNQRLLFYMDSVLTATQEGTTWGVLDYWPAEMVATLAHEFQHMIHFYQKSVLLGTNSQSSDSWIHEMMSMMTEDLVADKILVNGPRGVSYSDYTAGSSSNQDGRPILFNTYPYISQAYWANDSYVLARYSINYAFGAWLARNYGGAKLAHQLMATDGDNTTTVVNALASLGYTETYPSLLKKFWAAVMLSSRTDNQAPYIFNTGAAFTSTQGSLTYNLGSINFFNYGTGPRTFTSSNIGSVMSSLPAYSGVMMLAASGVKGNQTKTIDMPKGLELTVVVKPQ